MAGIPRDTKKEHFLVILSRFYHLTSLPYKVIKRFNFKVRVGVSDCVKVRVRVRVSDCV